MSVNQISLKRRVVSAGAWSLAGYAFSFVVRLGSNLVMARLLVPSMFGVVAIAQLIMVGLTLFSDMGFEPSVVRSKRGDDPAFLNTVWTTQILRGFLLWLVAVLIAVIIYLCSRNGLAPEGSVYSNPILPYVVTVVALGSILAGFQSTKALEAGRSLALASLTKIDLFSQLLGLLVMITWGITAPSIWALIAGALTAGLARTVGTHLWLSGVKNHWHFEREAFHEIIHFGKWIFLSSILFFIASNGDRLILGGLVDAELLGTYVVAFIFFNAIDQIFTKIVTDVSFPALSEIIRDRPAELTTAYYKFHGPIASFSYFCCGAIFVSGDSLIRFLYDSRYQQSGWILEILSIALLTFPLRIATQTFLALGVERIYFVLNATRVAALFCVLPLGFYIGGFYGAVWGIVISYFASVPMTIVYAGRHRMFELSKEALALLALIPGAATGEIVKMALEFLKHYFRH